MFKTEYEAYTEMEEVPGSLIPRLYGTVTYHSSFTLTSKEENHPTPASRRVARGILIEYLPSTSLKSFLLKALHTDPIPYDDISEVCNQAMGLIDRLDELKVLNEDIRLDNVSVVPTRMSFA
jgi:hypothetical protein